MKVLRNLWLLASVALFVNCSNEDNHSGGAKVVPVDDGGQYTETVVTLNRNGVKNGTATLRFYSNLDGIPYISIKDFHKVMLPKGSMTVSRKGDLYEIATSGGTAMVDVKADQFVTSSIISIFDMISLIGTDIPCSIPYDGSLYVKPKDMLLLPEVASVTFDFKKYSIDLHDDGSNVYFPYATLADIYSDMNMNNTYYNDGDKELIITTDEIDNYVKVDPDRNERIYGRQEVSDALAQFRYNELCFVFDYIYGYPGRDNELFRAGMEQYGLDAALDKAKSGSEVKQLLKSKDNAAFLLGMDGFQQLVDDGGHTSVSQTRNIVELPAVLARRKACEAQYPATVALVKEYSDNRIKLRSYVSKMQTLRKESYGDKKYIVSSDKSTAVIVLNSFMDMDEKGWKTYYASQKKEADWEQLLARDGNLLATFLSGVRQARKDGVKNVILDVTQNRGGSSDLVLAIESLIARSEAERQQVSMYGDFVLSKQDATAHYMVDRNFDGKFDDADAKVDYTDLSFAILTSHGSFSCGNLMPSMMKDSGFKVMGERSGGGACAIQNQFTPDGMIYIISCYRMRSLTARHESVDAGVPVDIEVPIEKFYDIDYLAEKFKTD